MLNGMTYTLTVNNVQDIAANPIIVNTEEQFTFIDLFTTVFQNGVQPTAAYTGAVDTYLSEEEPLTNAGSAVDLLADGDDPGGSGLDKSSLMAWDVSAIPAGSSVESASVIIEVTNPTQSTYSFQGMLRDWQENQATWNEYAASSPWNAPGALGAGDRGPSVLGIAAPTSAGTQIIPLNTDGVALMQAWVNGTLSNYGFVLSDTTSGDGLDFWSSDATTATNRPQLSVEFYSTPSDVDSDGIPDSVDNCLNDPNGPLNPDPEGNPDQQDENGDGVGDACDLLIPPQVVQQARIGNQNYSHELTILRSQVSHTCALVGGFLPASLMLDSDCFIRGAVTAGGVHGYIYRRGDRFDR